MKTIGKDGILLRLAKDMYPEKDDLFEYPQTTGQ